MPPTEKPLSAFGRRQFSQPQCGQQNTDGAYPLFVMANQAPTRVPLAPWALKIRKNQKIRKLVRDRHNQSHDQRIRPVRGCSKGFLVLCIARRHLQASQDVRKRGPAPAQPVLVIILSSHPSLAGQGYSLLRAISQSVQWTREGTVFTCGSKRH